MIVVSMGPNLASNYLETHSLPYPACLSNPTMTP